MNVSLRMWPLVEVLHSGDSSFPKIDLQELSNKVHS